jgi:HD-GYP domain-containing protein (c-di-GMP phosphodiesterase class II)
LDACFFNFRLYNEFIGFGTGVCSCPVSNKLIACFDTKEKKNMFQAPDYTMLDHLKAMCAVVDFNFRYIYVNNAAAQHEQMTRAEMLGHTITELHPKDETDILLPHLKECLEARHAVEFEDQSCRSKIKIEPVAEGAFIHWTRLPASKTKVKTGNSILAHLIADHGVPQHLAESKLLELDGWLDSLDLRTRESRDHISRVASATVALAELAGVSEEELAYIKYGALLHDIGKIGVPDRILLKPNSLTEEEWIIIRKHPLYAYDLFYAVEYLRSYLPIPYSHHERWDGTGYPQGLKGEEIPLAARLFAVIDVWDSLSCDRVYGKAWQQEKIMDYIQEESGTHFDPQVVDLFMHSRNALATLSPIYQSL